MTSRLPIHRIVRRGRLLRALTILSLLLIPADRAAADRSNFAKYQFATGSGQTTTYSAAYAVDGLVNNFHSFRTNNTTNPQWLELSFPRTVTIGSAFLYLGLDNDPLKGLPSFKFQYHNGSSWIDIPGAAVTGNTATELPVLFSSPVTSDRIRLYTDENGSRIIRELALFPPNLIGGVEQGQPVGTDVCLNLAYKRPATSSSANLTNIDGAGYAKNAFDGYLDNKSRWLCTSVANEYLEVDLLESHILGSAHVYTGYIVANDPTRTTTQPMADFKLQSWNGTAWIDIPGTNITGNTSVARAITFTSNVTTSKVRIVTTSASNGRVQELLLFPPRTGGYALGREVENRVPPTAKWNDFSDSSWKLDNSGPDLRLGLVNGKVVFANNASGSQTLDWQLLLNHRDFSYRVRHVATGDCLALGNISLATGTPVVVEPYTGLPHQDWFLDYVDATQFRLINAYSGLAINSAASSWNVGTAMVVTTPNTSNLQRWTRIYSTHYPKKGIAATHNDPAPWTTQTWLEDSWDKLNGATTTSWSYSWGRQSSRTFPFMPSTHTFIPMQWGGGSNNWTHGGESSPIDIIRNDLNSNPKPAHMMGFNEPDGADQANMTVDAAILRWPRLEALDAPLVAPCPANTFGTWLPDWHDKADALGYRRDYTPYHWYAAPNAGQMISDLQNAYNTYGRPIWLTEFSSISWSGSGSWTKGDNFNFLAEFMWRAESLSWLKRYSIFQFRQGSGGGTDSPTAPRGNTRNSDGSLTAYGQLYAGWDAVTGVVNDKAYHLHNRGAYLRVQNPASSNLIASSDPDTSATGTQWFLVPGTTANTVRICSTLDGRRLRFYTGVSVGLAASTNTQAQTEWRYVADQYGWYFIEHPGANQRLGINGSGDLVMGGITSSGDSYKWRFVVPATSDAVSPPAQPASLTATPSTTEIALSWPTVSGATSYTVHRSTASGGPWQQMATGLTTTSWTNTGLPYETRYYYTTTAVNALGSSSPSSPASATTLHPYSTYATWVQEKLSSSPAQDQTPVADPDHDSLNNLLEFAFLSDPAKPEANPFRTITAAPGTITLEFPWNWRASGLAWQLRHGSNLSNTAAWPLVAPGTTTITREGDIDRIRVSPAMAYPDRGFYVLEVIGN